MRTSLFIPVLACLLLGACASLPKPLAIGEVVRLSKSGTDPRRVNESITRSRTSYALRGADFGRLAQRGVASDVLDSLQNGLVANVDTLTRFQALGESYGGCDACYPQPVDLATLDTGGDGMTGVRNLGRSSSFARPQGVPEWVPATPAGVGTALIGAQEVLDWHRQSLAAGEIVDRVRGVRFTPVLDNKGLLAGGLTSKFKPGLSGSQLADLAKAGVPDDALDALQAIFLAGYVDFAYSYYRNLGKGPNP